MPLPPEKRLKFFVYIVEAPSAVDLYHKRYESDLLRQLLQLGDIECVSRLTISRDAFRAALTVGIAEEMKNYPNLIPVLHISAHGNDNGIGLSNGEIVTWENLKELVSPINQALGGALLIALSCCEGYAATKMAMVSADPPYFALVGSYDSPTWPETAVAYASFYHLVGKGELIVDAVSAMCTASGNSTFVCETAEESRKSYLDYVTKLNTHEAQEKLEESAQRQNPDELAKSTDLESGPKS